ncbi:FtsK/SpoIIIE domain-containing protein [Microbacterium atlanticum]|uniref:FtsK/SpoIIIE domain-containing protein n=1 Tax=Microbacterium atlanticum TaxID=2782168 RepID=UPI001887C2ED|nr:FtsK/SpoIIIE domain-containing protein [Microbacterium atlanticum]
MQALASPATTAPSTPDDEPLTLPPAWSSPARPPLPVVAAVVPVVGAGGLWLVTGSMYSLWFALLGPLIAAAAVFDARRAARRAGRRAAAEAARARTTVSSAVATRHQAERTQLWARHPDAARLLQRPGDVWRTGRTTALVVGEGERASAVRVSGGDGDPDAAALRRRAARVDGAPVTVPLDSGVAVVGGETVGAAVQRALALQLCLALAPGDLRIVGSLGRGLEWAEELPHRAAAAGSALAIVAPGELVPAHADIVIARCRPGDPPPPRCQAVVTVTSPSSARLEYGGEVAAIRVEAVSRIQAEEIAAALGARAVASLGMTRTDDGPIPLSPLLTATPPALGRGLPAVIGVADGDPAIVDLVADGPHAVVAGVTGAGKSELLITWILALCATRSADEVTFLLADFKGGTAFDGLAGLPHIAGVITDLDGSGARRAIDSLRAELRRREAAIAAAGARDIVDPRVALPRLVVVVDEFAALLADQPELHGLFADLAARGRALGIHLVLGTQRAAGVIRENLLANCPLRISLRVTDAADSRALLATDDAARLPGGVAGRGVAYVRRAGDAHPQPVRIALSGPQDVAAAGLRGGAVASPRPWLPELPSALGLDELISRAAAEAHEPGAVLLGVADEPDRQRQPVVAVTARDRTVLVLGGAGSGVTNVLDLIQAQAPGAVERVPTDLEGMWDAVARLSDEMPAPGTIVLMDDLDAVALRFPPEHAQIVLERVELLARRSGDTGVLVVAGAHRVTGAVSRVAELFARRIVLPFATRLDHAAAGGDPGAHDPSAPAGRGRLDRRTVQFALAPATPATPAARVTTWVPDAGLTGLVARRSPAGRRALAAWTQRGIAVLGLDEYVAEPGLVAQGPVVVAGEPDDWQRHWRLLADIRGDHRLIVDTSCAAELRALAGFRGVAPYCELGRARAWLMEAGGDPVRIVLPDADVEPNRRVGALTDDHRAT